MGRLSKTFRNEVLLEGESLATPADGSSEIDFESLGLASSGRKKTFFGRRKTASSRKVSTSFVEDEEPVIIEGWLLKEGYRKRSWKRRWFQVRGDTLTWFEAPHGGLVLGSFPLGFCVISNTKHPKSFPNTLKLKLYHGSSKQHSDRTKLVLSFDTPQQRSEWGRVFQSCSNLREHTVAFDVGAQGVFTGVMENDSSDSDDDAIHGPKQVTSFLRNELIPICKALLAALKPSDIDTTAKIVYSLTKSWGQWKSVLYELMKEEMKSVTSEGTVFRRNSLCSRLISLSLFAVSAGVLRQVVVPTLQLLAQSKDVDFEVDPSRLVDEKAMDSNCQALRDQIRSVMGVVLQPTMRWPSQVKELLRMVHTVVSTKFPDAAVKAAASVLFLRFLCPAFVSPASYLPQDVEGKDPDLKSMRSLILLTKVLQNIANDVRFGSKEPFMAPFNDIIEEFSPKVGCLINEFLVSRGDEGVSKVAEDESLASTGDETEGCAQPTSRLYSKICEYKEAIGKQDPSISEGLASLMKEFPPNTEDVYNLQSMIRSLSENVTLSENEDYRKTFNLPDSEMLIFSAKCELEKRICVSGTLYVSRHFICFRSRVFGYITSEKISPIEVASVEPLPAVLGIDVILSGGRVWHLRSVKEQEKIMKVMSYVCDIAREHRRRASVTTIKREDLGKPRQLMSGGLSNSDWSRILELARRCTFRCGDVVLEEGSAGDTSSLYCIGSGEATVVKGLGTSSAAIVAYLQPGQIFGEFSFVDKAPASASVLAGHIDAKSLSALGRGKGAEGLELYIVQSIAIDNLMSEDPRLGCRFFRYIALIISTRARQGATNARAKEPTPKKDQANRMDSGQSSSVTHLNMTEQLAALLRQREELDAQIENLQALSNGSDQSA